MSKLDQKHVDWSRQHFERMADGGVWGVPACGLMFQRSGKLLILISRMPHDPKMPITREALQSDQQQTFLDIKEYFQAAGITVVDRSSEPTLH